MNKRLIFILVFTLTVFSFLLSTPAFADDVGYGDFGKIYTVKTNLGTESTTPYSSFAWDEIPWLYLVLPNQLMTRSSVESDWFYAAEPGARGTADASKTGGGRTYWLQVLNWTDTNVRRSGSWNIDANFSLTHVPAPFGDGNTITGTGTAYFTVGNNPNPPVVPEPASSALFLVGGLALAATRFLKKKAAIAS